MSTYFLGLDVGTTSTKACAFTAQGTLSGLVEVSYPLEHPVPGAAVQSPMQILDSAESAITGLINKMGSAPQAIGLSCAMHSLVLCDEYETPITPVITWADIRAQSIMDHFSPEQRSALHRATGTPVHPMSPLVKLRWLLTTAPHLEEEAIFCYGLKSFLTKYWTGQALQDEQLASATGWYSPATGGWHQPALDLISEGDFPFVLPPVQPANTRLTWDATVAERLGVKDIPLYLGGSDGVLANLGSNILSPGVFALSVGTSGAVRTTHQQATIDPELGLFNYQLYGSHYAIGGATNNGGKVLAYWQELLKGHFPDMESFMAAALSVPPEQSPVFQPWLYGERAPLWDAAATAGFGGISGHHQPAHIAAAVLHGVTDNIVTIIRQLEEAVGPARQIQVTGGITKTPAWLKLLAEKCQREVIETAVPQATAYGAALVAMGALDELAST